MSEREPKLLIEDIIESADRIFLYTTDMSFDVFAGDNKTIDAVVRNFEIIGEAANRLPVDFKEKHTEIDWRRIKGLRNRIVHDYFGIDLSIVWKIKENYLKELKIKLQEKLTTL